MRIRENERDRKIEKRCGILSDLEHLERAEESFKEVGLLIFIPRR